MNTKVILSIVALLPLTCCINAQDESHSQVPSTENSISYTITAYNEERDKDAVDTLLQNNPYKLPNMTLENLEYYLMNDTSVTDNNVTAPQGNSVYIDTNTFAKVIAKEGTNQVRQATGFIFYSLFIMKGPTPVVLGLISLCSAEDSAQEKELLSHVLNELNEKKAEQIIVDTHTKNTIQHELLKQLGFSWACQNPDSNVDCCYILVNPTNIVQHATKDNVESLVKQSDLPVILDLYATWCPPCKQLAPIIEELAKETNGKYLFVKYNVETPCEYIAALGKELNFRGIPTLFFINNGEVKGVHTGYLSKEAFKEKIAQYLS